MSAGILLWGVLTLLYACALLSEFRIFGKRAHRKVYDLIAPYYTKLKCRSKAYRSVEQTERLFRSPLREVVGRFLDGTILDLGCGAGRMERLLLEDLRFQGRILAVDFSEGMLREAKASVSQIGGTAPSQVDFVRADIDYWKLPEEPTYAAVILLEASEYLADFEKIVSDVCLALQPGGLFLLTIPTSTRRLGFIWKGGLHSPTSVLQSMREKGFHPVIANPWNLAFRVVHAWKPRK